MLSEIGVRINTDAAQEKLDQLRETALELRGLGIALAPVTDTFESADEVPEFKKEWHDWSRFGDSYFRISDSSYPNYLSFFAEGGSESISFVVKDRSRMNELIDFFVAARNEFFR